MLVTNNLLVTYHLQYMPVEYVHLGSFSASNRVLEIDVQIKFSLSATEDSWTEYFPMKAFLDTGASVTHISKSVVPEQILELYKNFTIKGRAATTTTSGIRILKCCLRFPGLTASGVLFDYIFYTLRTIDDTKVIEDRLKEGLPHYPLIVGNDILEGAILICDGPSQRYSLQFNL
ncbi:MAG: hypothetical protein ABI763_14995 [Bacteroidota bacterium]